MTEVNGAEIAGLNRPAVPEVVTLLKAATKAAERGAIVGVAIGSVLDTLQYDGCSRSRDDIVVHNLLKSAAHMASLCDYCGCDSEIFNRDVWDPPVPLVIGILRGRLELAEIGRIRGVVIAMVGSDYKIDVVSVGENELVVNLLVGMHGEIGHAVLHAMSVVPDGPRAPALSNAALEAASAAAN